MEMRDRIKDRLGNKIKEWQDQSARRMYFSIDKSDIYKTVEFLFKELALRFSTATCTDTPDGLEMLYHFSFDKAGELYSVRTLIKDKNNPEIDSIAKQFRGAEWIEREIWEMFGVKFKGHPDLRKLLLSDDWPENDYPLRRKNEP